MFNLNKLPNKKPGERSILILRRHWLVPGKILFALLVATVMPPIIYLILQAESSPVLTHDTFEPALVLATSIYYLSIWMFMFQEIIDYYLDMWIVTTDRVIDIEQHGLFKRTSSELHLEDVVDSTSEIKGVIPTILDYGDVHIQTAGEQTRFHFKQISHPEKTRQKILGLVDKARRKKEKL